MGGKPEDDPYCDDLRAKLDDNMNAADGFAVIKGRVVELAFQSTTSSKLLQRTFEILNTHQQEEIAEEMRGHVVPAIWDRHANFVIQKLVEVLPTAKVAFVAEEMRESACCIARHRYGCRITQRLLEHSSPASEALFEKIIKDAKELCRTVYGHYVIVHLLEHGTAEQKAAIGNTLSMHFEVLAQCRHSRDVMLKALEHCSQEQQECIAAKVFNLHARQDDLRQLVTLALSKNGHQLIAAALNGNEQIKISGMDKLMHIAPWLSESFASGNKHARHVLQLLSTSS